MENGKLKRREGENWDLKIKTQRREGTEKKSLRLRVLAFYTEGARIENVKYIVYKKIETQCK